MMFQLSPTTDEAEDYKSTEKSICNTLPKDTPTDSLCHRSKKSCEQEPLPLGFSKVEVYKQIKNVSKNSKYSRSFINHRFGSSQPLKKSHSYS